MYLILFLLILGDCFIMLSVLSLIKSLIEDLEWLDCRSMEGSLILWLLVA